MPKPSLAKFTALYLRVGNTTFGGGDPTAAVLQRELVTRHGWLSAEQYALAFSLARITPGTNITAFCAGTGWMILGWTGAVAAVLSEAVPSAILSVWLLKAYDAWRSNSVAADVIAFIVAAVVGMMMASIVLLVKPRVRSGGWLRVLVITGGAALLLGAGQVSPVVVILLAATVGFLWREPVRR